MADQMMPPQLGEFCWTEIATGNLQGCIDFYQNVFGWTFNPPPPADAPMDYREFSGPPASYPIGGMYQISAEILGSGPLPPPHFLNYVAVENVDDTAAKATELGATILRPPMDVPNVGRMTIITDPAGAMIAFITLNSVDAA